MGWLVCGGGWYLGVWWYGVVWYGVVWCYIYIEPTGGPQVAVVVPEIVDTVTVTSTVILPSEASQSDKQ